MSTHSIWKFPLVVALFYSICSLVLADGQDRRTGVKRHDKKQDTYYSIYPDNRLCIFPLCGGYWIAKVNHKRLRCSNVTGHTATFFPSINQPLNLLLSLYQPGAYYDAPPSQPPYPR